VKKSLGHYVQNMGKHRHGVLEIFKPIHYAEVSLSDGCAIRRRNS